LSVPVAALVLATHAALWALFVVVFLYDRIEGIRRRWLRRLVWTAVFVACLVVSVLFGSMLPPREGWR